MFDTPGSLLDKIRLGEDSFLELKEVRIAGKRVSAPHRDSLADSLETFANAPGGVCMLRGKRSLWAHSTPNHRSGKEARTP